MTKERVDEHKFDRYLKLLSLASHIPGAIFGIAKSGELVSRHKDLLPYEIIGGLNSLKEFKKSLGEGNSGIVITNHFSLRDALVGPQIALRFMYPFPGKAVMPVARHNYKPWMGETLRNFGIEVMPIFDARSGKIKETLRSEKPENRSQLKETLENEYRAYTDAAIEALRNNGVLGIAAQATREPSLGDPRVFPIKAILESVQNMSNPINESQVVILPIGIGMKGVTNYSDKNIRGYNTGEEFTVKFGRPEFLSTALELTKDMSLPNVDWFINRMLKAVSPAEYVAN
jgi:hypothetical protein